MIYSVFLEKKIKNKFSITALYGIGSGGLITGIVFSMMFALENGEASVVLPITQMSFLLTAVIGIFLFKESLNIKKVTGLLFGIICIIMMAAG
jgi:uncharacterized membrane protein